MGRICNPEREAHVLYEAPFSKYTAKCALQFQQRSWGPWTLDGNSCTYKTNVKNYWLGHTHTSVGVSLLGSMV